jgi:hypothetical protein
MRQIILAAAFALAACGQMPWANHASTTSTSTTSTSTSASGGGKVGETPSAPDSGKPAGGETADSQSGASSAKPNDNYSIVGLWGDNGDCKQFILIRENGTFLSYTGGQGNWTLGNDQLTLVGAGGTVPMGVHWVDADHVDLVNANGSVGHSQRCPDNGVE